jgi:hypothetical protein
MMTNGQYNFHNVQKFLAPKSKGLIISFIMILCNCTDAQAAEFSTFLALQEIICVPF